MYYNDYYDLHKSIMLHPMRLETIITVLTFDICQTTCYPKSHLVRQKIFIPFLKHYLHADAVFNTQLTGHSIITVDIYAQH